MAHPHAPAFIARALAQDTAAATFKITNQMVEGSASLTGIGIEYVKSYTGDNRFIAQLRAFYLSHNRLSAAQLRAALNTMLDAERDARKPKPAAEAAPFIDLRSNTQRQLDSAADTPTAGTGEIVPVIPNGWYTVIVDSESGKYYTIRVTDAPEKFNRRAGSQMASFLTGADNERDYTGFAFIEGDKGFIWKRFKDEGYDALRAALAMLISDPMGAAREYVLRSNNCFVCGHRLTTPTSIANGIGPVCAKKVGEMGYTFSFTGSTLSDEIAAADRAIERDAEAPKPKRVRGTPRRAPSVPTFANGRSTDPALDSGKSAQDEVDELFA